MDNGKYEVVDESTGEITEEPVIEGRAESRYETAPIGQEIIPDGYDRAADGAIMQTVANTAGNFVDMLEDGAYSREVQAKLREVAAAMTAITSATGTKTKGKVTLTIDLEKEGEHFSVRAKVASKAPELPRPKSIVWADHDGRFTRFPPQQTQMFGMRPVRNAG